MIFLFLLAVAMWWATIPMRLESHRAPHTAWSLRPATKDSAPLPDPRQRPTAFTEQTQLKRMSTATTAALPVKPPITIRRLTTLTRASSAITNQDPSPSKPSIQIPPHSTHRQRYHQRRPSAAVRLAAPRGAAATPTPRTHRSRQAAISTSSRRIGQVRPSSRSPYTSIPYYAPI